MQQDFVDLLLSQWTRHLPNSQFDGLAVFARLARFTNFASKEIYQTLGEFGLTESQVNLLAALYRSGPPHRLTPKALAEAMLLTPGTITYVIDQMETAGNVVRRNDVDDRRKILIELTSKGKQLVRKAMKAHLEVTHELLAPLSESERKNLIGSLRTLLISVDDFPNIEKFEEDEN